MRKGKERRKKRKGVAPCFWEFCYALVVMGLGFLQIYIYWGGGNFRSGQGREIDGEIVHF